MSAEQPPFSAVEQFINRRGPRQEPEVERAQVREAFDEMRMPRTRGRESIMLDVRLADGHCTGFGYAYLMRVDFEPGDRVRAHFAASVLTIEGRRLQNLYRRLLDHRVEAIQEGTEAEEELKPSEAAHIDRIIINTAEEIQDVGSP